MVETLWDIYTWINIGALVCVFIDKCAEGEYEILFYLAGTVGPLGTLIGCFLFHHHTRSGGCIWPAIVGLVHWGIYELAIRIIGFFGG